jgi:hypothetical protein
MPQKRARQSPTKLGGLRLPFSRYRENSSCSLQMIIDHITLKNVPVCVRDAIRKSGNSFQITKKGDGKT